MRPMSGMNHWFMNLIKRLPALATVLLTFSVSASTNVAPARLGEIAAMLPPRAIGLGSPISDRAAWTRLSTNTSFAGVIANAERISKQPVPVLTDDLFLDFSRTGNRGRCQAVTGEREERLKILTLAECLENRGHFIAPLTNLIATICAEKTWVYPAHDRRLDNFYGRTMEMELRATSVAWQLATADHLLGDQLPKESRNLIRQEVRRRVLGPFRDMVEGRRAEIRWMRSHANWNPVCLAGIIGAALALEESPTERAWYVAAAELYINHYFLGYTSDGYCNEGLGYWNYGFGRFVMLGETIRQATRGGIDLLATPSAQLPALFGNRFEIQNGIYPTISDCVPGTKPDPALLRYIDERFGLPLTGDRNGVFTPMSDALPVLTLFAFLPDRLPRAQAVPRLSDSPLRTWFKDAGVLITRNATEGRPPFAAVLKGGHNAESHNHNDVGSFSVTLGNTMVLCDPGLEVYTARTFSADRYLSKVLSSYGHATPVIAGKLQSTGPEARGVVRRAEFTQERDTLTLDIRSAYALPELKRLERTFCFQRAGASALVVGDEVEFSRPQHFETALITWGKWEQLAENELVIRDGNDAVRVRINTGGQAYDIKSETLDEAVRSQVQPKRISIALRASVLTSVVTITITPEPAS